MPSKLEKIDDIMFEHVYVEVVYECYMNQQFSLCLYPCRTNSQISINMQRDDNFQMGLLLKVMWWHFEEVEVARS